MIAYWAPVTLGLLILVVMLLPVAVLVYAAFTISGRLRGAHAGLLITGAVLLAFASLDSAFNYFSAYLLDPQAMAGMIVYTSFVFEALNFVALILIGSGLIRLSRALGSKGTSE